MAVGQTFHALRVLTRSQQGALMVLRKASSLAHDTASLPLLDQAAGKLAAHLPALRLTLMAPGSGFAAGDEYLLIAALALGQRPGSYLILEQGFVQAVSAFSAALAAAEIHLPLSRPMLRQLTQAGWVNKNVTSARLATARARARQHREEAALQKLSMRERVIALATGRASIAAAELRSIGVSRQYLSQICTSGQLERVGYGRYRLTTVAQKELNP